MVLEAEIRIPSAAAADFRRVVLARAPREGEDTCQRCGADRFHLLDALLDPESWENRGLAASIIGGCPMCRQEMTGILAEARSALAHNGSRTEKCSHSHQMV